MNPEGAVLERPVEIVALDVDVPQPVTELPMVDQVVDATTEVSTITIEDRVLGPLNAGDAPTAPVATANEQPKRRFGLGRKAGAALLLLAVAGGAAGCSSGGSTSNAEPTAPSSAAGYNPAACTTSLPSGEVASVDVGCAESHFDKNLSATVRRAIDATVTVAMGSPTETSSTTGIIDGPNEVLTAGHLKEGISRCVPANSSVIAKNPTGPGGIKLSFLGIQDGWRPIRPKNPTELPESPSNPDAAEVFVGGSNKAMGKFEQLPEVPLEADANPEPGSIVVTATMQPNESGGDMRSWSSKDPNLNKPNIEVGVVIEEDPQQKGLYYIDNVTSLTPGGETGTIGGSSGADEIDPANGKIVGLNVVGFETPDGNESALNTGFVAAVTGVTVKVNGQSSNNLNMSVMEVIPPTMTGASAPC